MSQICNDPGFIYTPVKDSSADTSKMLQTSSGTTTSFLTKKTDLDKPDALTSAESTCVLHGAKHGLNDCKAFQKLTLSERKKLLKDYKMCFRCCESSQHTYKTCNTDIKCKVCGKTNHATALHSESWSENSDEDTLVAKCTAICGQKFNGRSCAKAILVNVYPDGRPDLGVKLYALLDDQSNSTLGRTEFSD